MSLNSMDADKLCDEAVDLFKSLLRIDTTNPPGRERAAAELLAERLRDAGLDPWIGEPADERANLVVRVPATVEDPDEPLLLAGHTDVVPADASRWTHPPFEAVEADGCIWGRGAVDMKNMVAMSAMATIAMSRREHRTRDVIFAAVADEETGCEFGSEWLVEEHPERIRAEYMFGEVGGFWLHIGGEAYLPVMHAEKGRAELRLRARGASGHGSIPDRESAPVKLARAVEVLGKERLSFHLTDTMARFLTQVAATQPIGTRIGLQGLRRSWSAGFVIDNLLPNPSIAKQFDALLHNTAAPTLLRGGESRNQIPSEVTCELDGRPVPGVTGEELKADVEEVLRRGGIDVVGDGESPGVEVELLDFQPGMETDSDPAVMGVIRDVLEANADPVTPVPNMIPGYTDARNYSRLGTKCFGFSPVKFTEDFDAEFGDLFHGVDERIPVEGFRWGMRRLDEVVSRMATDDG